MIKRVQKLWGSEEWVHNGAHCVKWLTIEPRRACSLHMHPAKEETFTVIEGDCVLEVDGSSFSMFPKESWTIDAGTPHRFRNESFHRPCLILESSTHHSDDDVVRLEESKKLDAEV